MDDLPASPLAPTASATTPASPTGSMAKETVAGGLTYQEVPVLTEIGTETDLPHEVKSAGVTTRQSNVSLSSQVAGMGVRAVGTQAPVSPIAPTVTLPLSDDKIAGGLRQSLTTSWRWLAQWCVRQLKIMHIRLKSGGVNAVRERDDE